MKRNIPFIISEIGQAHDGSLGMIYAYIDALAATGTDAVKFQMHIAKAESSIYEPFRVKFSRQDATRFDYWERMEFTLEQWKGIKSHCEGAGLEFLCSPFSLLAVDWLEEIGVKSYKVGSGEITNLLLLEKIAKTGKPVIISSGMSSYDELDQAVDLLKAHNVDFSILQCTTSYPTLPEQYGFNVIGELKQRYQVPIGYSDHSARVETCIAATALGAEILEFHVVFDRNQFGPDAKSSLTIAETTALIGSVRRIYSALQNPVDKTDNSGFMDLKQIFEKSLAVNKNLKKGHTMSFDDLEAKKPRGYGIAASEFHKIIGRKLTSDKNQWDFLNPDDLYE